MQILNIVIYILYLHVSAQPYPTIGIDSQPQSSDYRSHSSRHPSIVETGKGSKALVEESRDVLAMRSSGEEIGPLNKSMRVTNHHIYVVPV